MKLVCIPRIWGTLLIFLILALCVEAGEEGQAGNRVSFAIESNIRASNSASQEPPANRSLVLQEIMDRDVRISQRLRAAAALTHGLNADEVSSLFEFLKSRMDSADKNLPGTRALKNEIMNALRHQAEPLERLTALLIEIYNDTEQDEVIRDYSVQHLGVWCQQGANGKGDEQGAIRRFLQRVVQDNSSISGTALIALHRLSEGDSEMDEDLVDAHALTLVSSPQTHFAARISAIQICSERRIAGALPIIETLIPTSENIPLRLSAIAAVGRLGDVRHLSELQKLQEDSNELVRTGVRKALDQIKHRLQLF